MKSRWFSRGLLVSMALVSASLVAACARPDGSDQSPQKPEQAVEETHKWGQHAPGYRVFRQIDTLDLSEDQRDDLREIEEDLASDLTSHRKALLSVAETLAHSIETGELDERRASENQKALTEAAVSARITIIRSINEVHDTLDRDQREELVSKLEEQREKWKNGRAERRRDGLSGLAERLGLSDQQRQVIRDEVQRQIDSVVPDRKAKREAWEAKMKLVSEAFIEDDFDAADFDLGGEAEQMIATFTGVSKRAIALTGDVLNPSQRVLLAQMIRARTAEIAAK